jgi:hypothetical protein
VSDAGNPEGLSRRELIKRSAVAGGIVWAAPTLLSGRAAAQVPCCGEGTPVTIKVAEQGGVNCGVACISSRGFNNFDCPPDLVNCLGDLELVVGDFTSGGADTAHIILAPGVELITAAVKASQRCYFSDCPCHASSPSDAQCPNTCENENSTACRVGNDPITIPPNRIWVVPNSPGPGQTSVFINTHAQPDGVLNHVELSVCVAPEVTALCP